MGKCNKTLMDRLLLLQKKSSENYLQFWLPCTYDNLFSTNRILRINEIYSLQLGVFMFLLNNNELPHIFNSMFARNSTFIIIPHDSLDHFTYQGSEHFLQITFLPLQVRNYGIHFPPNLTRLKSIHSFKRFLKHKLLSKPSVTTSR